VGLMVLMSKIKFKQVGTSGYYTSLILENGLVGKVLWIDGTPGYSYYDGVLKAKDITPSMFRHYLKEINILK